MIKMKFLKLQKDIAGFKVEVTDISTKTKVDNAFMSCFSQVNKVTNLEKEIIRKPLLSLHHVHQISPLILHTVYFMKEATHANSESLLDRE